MRTKQILSRGWSSSAKTILTAGYYPATNAEISVVAADALAFAETANLLLNSFIDQADAFVFAETTALEVATSIAVFDALTIAETVRTLATALISANDTFVLSEQIWLSLAALVQANDNVAFTDAALVRFDAAFSVADQASLSEIINIITSGGHVRRPTFKGMWRGHRRGMQ